MDQISIVEAGKEEKAEKESKLYDFDLDLYKEKKCIKLIGVDEAGRGPLAGPVVAGATILKDYSHELDPINDSKKLTEKKREFLYDVIKEHFYVGIGMSSHEEIDEINILNATFLAMRRAIDNLISDLKKDLNIDESQIFKYLVIVDGNHTIREYPGSQEAIIKGDGKSLCIAAASIMAKVTRDRIMIEQDKIYPQYGFKKHKGYGTKMHIKAIEQFGPSPIHRESFLKKILHPDPKLIFE